MIQRKNSLRTILSTNKKPDPISAPKLAAKEDPADQEKESVLLTIL